MLNKSQLKQIEAVREKLSGILPCPNIENHCPYNVGECRDCPELSPLIDDVVNIAEIAILDKDQSLPETYFANRKKMPWISDYNVEICAQQDMLSAHFQRTIDKEALK